MVETRIKRIGIVANCAKPEASSALRTLENKSRELGMTLVTCDETAEFLGHSEKTDADQFDAQIDVLMALGGDGTMLSAVRRIGNVNVPVLGVNLGSLGFMTSVTQDEIENALTVLAEGTFTTSSRSLAICRIFRNGDQITEHRSLNDMVVGWGESSRVITLTVLIDGIKVTSYECDGLIVSTPTGSTGHQLSAGGPILHPETPAFIINVICPHTISTRPLVVPDDRVITVHITKSPKTLIMSIDGQERENVDQNDRMEIVRDPEYIRFIHLPGYNYFSVLRQKLGWRGSVR